MRSDGSAWRQNVRRAARAIRHAPDRLLHPWRRHRARIHADSRPRSVLFICYGNICRSPYAAAAYRRLAGDGVRVTSAGLIGPGRASPAEAQAVASRRGLDLTEHRSQLITASLLEEYDLVVVMERAQASALREYGRVENVLVLGDMDPEPIDTRTILDPYSRAEDVFEAVYDRIDRCVRALCAS
jgi:protein-tyrosine phosphatase